MTQQKLNLHVQCCWCYLKINWTKTQKITLFFKLKIMEATEPTNKTAIDEIEGWPGWRILLTIFVNCLLLWFLVNQGIPVQCTWLLSIKNSHWTKNHATWGLTVHCTTYIAKLARSIYLLTTSHKKAFVLPLENRSSCYN